MTTKHTPALWHVGKKYTSDVYAHRAGHAIARCVNPQYDGECEANARLIAAAPELLEALSEIVNAADGAGWKKLDASFSKARAAIAKAEGGAA